MQLKLGKRTVDGILVVQGTGRIVFGEESSLLRDELKKAVADGNKKIVLNLGEISYIDSGGLGTLVALHTTAHNAGGAIKLANLTRRVGDLTPSTQRWRRSGRRHRSSFHVPARSNHEIKSPTLSRRTAAR
jgi:anti-sigma B factor antagonist